MPAKDESAEYRKDFKELVSKIGKGLDTNTVFGETRVIEGRAVIPVASISYGGGGGTGSGGGPADTPDETPPGGEGMGMGFGIKAKPIGVIEVTADSLRWVPTVDVTKLVVMCVLGGVFLGTVGRAMGSCCRGRCKG